MLVVPEEAVQAVHLGAVRILARPADEAVRLLDSPLDERVRPIDFLVHPLGVPGDPFTTIGLITISSNYVTLFK